MNCRTCGLTLFSPQQSCWKNVKSENRLHFTGEKSQVCEVFLITPDFKDHIDSNEHRKSEEAQRGRIKRKYDFHERTVLEKHSDKHEFSVRHESNLKTAKVGRTKSRINIDSGKLLDFCNKWKSKSKTTSGETKTYEKKVV